MPIRLSRGSCRVCVQNSNEVHRLISQISARGVSTIRKSRRDAAGDAPAGRYKSYFMLNVVPPLDVTAIWTASNGQATNLEISVRE